MGQVSAKLRRAQGGYMHYCPACDESHILPDGWKFDGNLDRPTFSPSFKHSDGAGGWICHYVLTAGILHFQADCSHKMRGPVPLPDIPEGMSDLPFEKIPR